MKIRTGFVSNSSTTSFCIYGCRLDEREAVKLMVKNGIFSQDEVDDGDSGELLWMLKKSHGLGCHMGESDTDVYIGIDFTDIPDDVNVGEWKKEAEEKIKKVFGQDVKCYVQCEGRDNH